MPQLGPFCFSNTTGKRVNDLHVIFAGTGGTLRGAKITAGPKGRIRASTNQVDIVWKNPIGAGATVCFTVTCRFRAVLVYDAFWTRTFNIVGPATQIPRK
jgi:hypothetical protein